MTDPRLDVLAHLGAAARARRRHRAGRHAASALSLACGLALTATVAVTFAPGLRAWFLVALASASLVGLGMIAASLLRRERPWSTAAWIARRSPELGGALADAVEFSDRLGRGEHVPTGSDDLARAHVSRAAGLASGTDPGMHARALPPPPWRTAWGLLGALALVLVLVPEGRRTLLFGPKPPAPPRVGYGSVQLTYRHPAYLRLPDRVETGAGDVEAPVGTHVEVRVRADRPLSLARMEPADGAAIEMGVAGDVATGTLVVTKPGSYRIVLRGAAGEIDPEPPVHVVRAIADASPRVRLRSPRQDVVLSEGEILGIEWIAEDDHGIAEAALVVRRGAEESTLPDPGAADEQAQRLPLGAFDPPEADRAGSASFSTADLGLIAGDEAWLWVEARDDDAVTGPKWDASSRILVSVRSEVEEDSALRQGRDALGEALLALLASHLVAGPSAMPDSAAVAAHHRDFAPKLASAGAMASQLAQMAEEESDDPASAMALQDMRARLESLSRTRLRREPALLSEEPARAIGVHAELHEREIPELERDVLFFDMWADRRASLRAADAAEELLAAAQQLSEDAEATEPEATPEELLSTTQEIARESEALKGMLGQLAQAAGADPAAAEEARESLRALQETARSLGAKLERGDRSSARRDAERMEATASELADRVGDLSDAGAMGDPELQQEMQRLEGDLRRLRRDQADLRDETNQLREDAREALSPEDLQRAEEAFAELERLAAEAVAAHASADAKLAQADEVSSFFDSLDERERVETRLRDLLRSGRAMTDEGAKELQDLQARLQREERAQRLGFDEVEGLMRNSMNAREMLGRLQQVIGDRDLDAARLPARYSLDILTALREDVGQEGPLSPAHPGFTTAAAKAAEIVQRLDEAQSQLDAAAQGAMTSAQREKLASLGNKQGQMQAQARGLAGRMRDLSADAPFLGDDVAGRVDEAGGFMDEATQGLFSRRPGEASESQGEALARLDEAAKALSPTQSRDDAQGRAGSRGRQPQAQGQGRPSSGRDGGDRGMDGRRGRTSRERVEIPDADDFKVPKEFREEILEAMRESSAPEGYAEQVREYYRRLVE